MKKMLLNLIKYLKVIFGIYQIFFLLIRKKPPPKKRKKEEDVDYSTKIPKASYSILNLYISKETSVTIEYDPIVTRFVCLCC